MGEERGAWMRKRKRNEDGTPGWEGPEWVAEDEVAARMHQKWRQCAAPEEASEEGVDDGM